MHRSIALITAVLMFAGCGGSPERSAVPSSPAASTEPSLANASDTPLAATTEPTGPSWTARPAEALLLNSLVYVNVDRLNLRERPTVDSTILGVVKQGDFLHVTGAGPIRHDGYTWYPAVFLANAGEPPSVGVDVRESDGMQGWIAVGKVDTSYVERLKPRCPAAIDLASIKNMLGSELLACFGGNTLELTGTFGCSGCGGFVQGDFKPVWLAQPVNLNVLAPYKEPNHFVIVLHFPPSGPGAPPVSSLIRVRGHLDDAAATTCEISVTDPLHPSGDALVAIPAAAAHLTCAQEFVVESLDVLGTDPSFIFG